MTAPQSTPSAGVRIPPMPAMTDDEFRAHVAELVDVIDLADPVIDLSDTPRCPTCGAPT